MVYYFTSNIIDPPTTIYVGKDKFENEELIKFGWDCDFHADNLSSAHVYLRLTPEQKWDALPPALVEECAQLTKANSIEGASPTPYLSEAMGTKRDDTYAGNKKDNVTVVYTPWSNLLKNNGMATGQVSFHDAKKVKRTLVSTRINATINRLDKTKRVISADELPAAKEVYMAGQRAERRREAEKKKKEEEKFMKERREEKENRERGYDDLMASAEGRSNEDGFDEDDFM